MSLPVQTVDPQRSASTLVLLHGAPSAPGDLVPLAERLGEHHRVLIPTLPGYLGTARPVPFTLEAVQAAVEETLLAMGAEEVGLVGFSLGGYHAVSLALRGRLRVRAIATLGGFAGLLPEERAGLGAFAPMLRALPDASDPGLRALLKGRMLSPRFLEQHPEAGEQVARWLDLLPPSWLGDELEASAGAPDLYEPLKALEIPVLARVGELDPAAPPAQSQRLIDAARRGTLQIVPGAGHALNIEDLEATAEALRRFFAQA